MKNLNQKGKESQKKGWDNKMNSNITHPGKRLSEVLERLDMSQKELAVRTGVTEKHISTVINGSKGISAGFAKKLEYALGIDALNWMEWQAEYEKQSLDFEEQYGITQDELDILKRLKDIIAYFEKREFISKCNNDDERVLEVRKAMGVANLLSIPEITYSAAYRAQVKKNAKVDPYVLYAWQRLCERETADISVKEHLDIDRLRESIQVIKALMFKDINEISDELTELLADCGVAFKIVHHFTGAPVQGFIRNPEGKERIILCMTLRGKRADRFWFTLFHEIGHILHGDAGVRFVDFQSVKNAMEDAADLFAQETLINTEQYRAFLVMRDYSLPAIRRFAKTQGVQPYIIIGRLQSDEIIEWSTYSDQIETYEWIA